MKLQKPFFHYFDHKRNTLLSIIPNYWVLYEIAACGDLLGSPVHYPDYMGCLSSNEFQVIFCSMLMQGRLGWPAYKSQARVSIPGGKNKSIQIVKM